jgi:hypothetical protein
VHTAVAAEESGEQTSSKFSLRIWLDKQTLSDHRNSIKLGADPLSRETSCDLAWGHTV